MSARLPLRLPRPSSHEFSAKTRPPSVSGFSCATYAAARSSSATFAVSSPTPGQNIFPSRSVSAIGSISGKTVSVCAMKSARSAACAARYGYTTFSASSMKTPSAPCAVSQSLQNAARLSSRPLGAGIAQSVRSSAAASSSFCSIYRSKSMVRRPFPKKSAPRGWGRGQTDFLVFYSLYSSISYASRTSPSLMSLKRSSVMPQS